MTTAAAGRKPIAVATPTAAASHMVAAVVSPTHPVLVFVFEHRAGAYEAHAGDETRHHADQAAPAWVVSGP